MGSKDSPDFFALNDDVLHYLKPTSENNSIPPSQNPAHNQCTQINEDINLNCQTSPSKLHR